MGGPPFSRGSYPSRGRYPAGAVRKNERIRAREVRLIGPDERQIGVVSQAKALALARSAGLDLVEISPKTRPPVCRITDYGKYMYDRKKRDRDRGKQSSGKSKEFKLRVNIDAHDYATKLRRFEDFLSKGYKVKVTLMFRGRELQYPELGFERVKGVVKDLEHVARPDGEPRRAGRQVGMMLSPLPSRLRGELKYGAERSSEGEAGEAAEAEGNAKAGEGEGGSKVSEASESAKLGEGGKAGEAAEAAENSAKAEGNAKAVKAEGGSKASEANESAKLGEAAKARENSAKAEGNTKAGESAKAGEANENAETTNADANAKAGEVSKAVKADANAKAGAVAELGGSSGLPEATARSARVEF